MRSIFAHETAHSFQPEASDAAMDDKLLFMALNEGTPDFLASLVTGVPPSPAREAYGRPIEAKLWAQFQQDRALLRGKSWAQIDQVPELKAAMRRWFANYGNTPPGVPFEMGYWIGMQIASAFVEKAADKKAAIDALLTRGDPVALAKASGYAGGRAPQHADAGN